MSFLLEFPQVNRLWVEPHILTNPHTENVQDQGMAEQNKENV